MDFLLVIKEFVIANPRLVLGNAVGFISAIFGFASYQSRTPKKLLVLQCCVSLTAIASYAILNAWSGMALNIVCLLRNFTYTEKARKIKLFSMKPWAYIMAVILGAIGALSWEGPISLLVIIPLMINTVVLSWSNNTRLRQSILLTSSMIIVYDVYANAYFSAFMEMIAITSSVIGLIRYKNK